MLTSLSDRAGFLIIANLFKYAVGFVMPMVLVRLLSQSDYGSYQQLLLVASALTGILTLGLPGSVYYFYHFVKVQALPALILQTTLMLLAAGVLGSAIMLIGATHFATAFSNPALHDMLWTYAAALTLMIGSEHCLHCMIAQNRYAQAVLFEIGETVVRVAMLLLPLAFGFGVHGLLLGLVAYAALRYVVRNGWLLGRSGLIFQGWVRAAFPIEQLRYSLPAALVAVCAILSASLNRGMLASSFTAAQFAVYAVGALEIPLDVIFQASVANVLRASLPPLVRDGRRDDIVRLLRESTRKLSIIVLPSFIFLYGYSHEFITLLFTAKYADSVPVFRIYLWLMPLSMSVLSVVPQVFGKPRINFYIVLAMSGLMVVLGYGLLRQIGFYGAALAVVITQYLQMGLYFAVVCRLTGARMMQLVPVVHLLRVAVAGGAGLAAARLLDGHLGNVALLNLLGAGIVFSVVFFVAALPLQVLSHQDGRLIRRWLARLCGMAAG